MKQIKNLDNVLKHLQEEGATRRTLRNQYHLTEYGAKKLTNLIADREEKLDGRGTLKFHLDREKHELDQETLEETIPVSVSNSKNLRATQRQKQSLTRSAHNYLEQLERDVKAIESPVIDWEDDYNPNPHGVDLIWHETDAHFGALTENEHGEIIYDTETATERLKERTAKFCHLAVDEGRDINTIHFLLGGDWMEGTAIYQGQGHEVDMNINEQFEKVRTEYFKVIKQLIDLAHTMDAKLQIVSAHGNHGELRAGGSNKANVDDMMARTLNDMTGIFLDENQNRVDVDVRFKHSDSTMGMTFPIRNKTGYLVHGQNFKEHVGTSSGKKDALAKIHRYNADIIFRGHFHMNKIEDVGGVPVVMTGSPKPAGQFEDSISEYGEPAGAFYVASDDCLLDTVKYLKYDV